MMTQGILPFRYEGEPTTSGMTALAGLPPYLELAVVSGLTDSVRRRLKVCAEQKQILLPVKNEGLNVLSDSAAETQVMLSGKQALKDAQKAGILNQLDAYRFNIAQRAGNSISFMWDIGNRDLPGAPTGSSLLRQDNMAALL